MLQLVSDSFKDERRPPGLAYRAGELGRLVADMYADIDRAFVRVEAVVAALASRIDAEDTVVNVSPYTVLDGDVYLLVTADGAVTINLPPGSAQRTLWIKDKASARANGAATDNITVVAAGAETIDGLGQLVLNADNVAVQLRFSGTEWSIF